MSKNGCKYCPPKKRRRADNNCKKIGILMLLFGGITVLSMFLPLKLWIILLCAVLIVCGVMLLKK